MDIVLLTIRLLLATVFTVAGIGKLADPAGSRKALEDFGVPPSLSGTLAISLPIAEIAIAASLLLTQSSWFGAIGCTLFLLAFTGGMAYQLAKGNAPDCHCFGQIHSEPVGKSTIIRNIVLLIISSYLVLSGPLGQGLNLIDEWRSSGQNKALLAIGVLLVVTLIVLVRVLIQQREILRRLADVELIAAENTAVERNDAGHPDDGLPIGAVFPDFELPDLNGAIVTLTELLADRKPILFFFISPTCNPCKSLLPDFAKWEDEFDARLKVVFVSKGTADENRQELAGEDTRSILLQKDRELADLAMARWTPTALLIGADGRVKSHVAAGDMAIRELIEKLRSADLNDRYGFFANGHSDSHVLRIGDSIPDFSLTDLEGNEVTSKTFNGKPTLLAFWSTTCPHCTRMMDELREWEAVKETDAPNLTVFANGDADEHRSFGLKSSILLDENYETAEMFGMSGTPSAVLIDEHGRFATETAVGASAIWSLIGHRK